VILDHDVNFLPSQKTVVQTTKVPLFLTLTIDESPSQNERSLEEVKTLISNNYPFLAGFIILSFFSSPFILIFILFYLL